MCPLLIQPVRSPQRDSPWLYLEDVTLLLPPLELAVWRDVALHGDTRVNLDPAALQLIQQELAAAGVQAAEGAGSRQVLGGAAAGRGVKGGWCS